MIDEKSFFDALVKLTEADELKQGSFRSIFNFGSIVPTVFPNVAKLWDGPIRSGFTVNGTSLKEWPSKRPVNNSPATRLQRLQRGDHLSP